MATETESNSTGLDMVYKATKDALSTYVDIVKQKHDASTYERIARADGEQAYLTRTAELQYQNRGAALDVRSSPSQPVSFSVPPWVMWVGGGVALLGAAAVVYKAVTK